MLNISERGGITVSSFSSQARVLCQNHATYSPFLEIYDHEGDITMIDNSIMTHIDATHSANRGMYCCYSS